MIKYEIIQFCLYIIGYESNENTWSGKFFPFGPGEKDNNPVVKKIMMGMVDPECDDGKVCCFLKISLCIQIKTDLRNFFLNI